ncbi:MAG: carboxypeptidase-like regulatory domain-containing protein [Bacteroidota bacterium]
MCTCIINNCSFAAGLLLFSLAPTLVWAQNEIYLAGTVRDSATYQTLSYVNIQHNTGKVISASDGNGYFSLTAHLGDTLVFTRLGYEPFLFIPQKNEWDLNIRLNETSKMLQNITIYDNFEIHGQNQIQQTLREDARISSSPWQNPTAKPGSEYAVQTFGPGMVLSGPFSRFSKEEVEKRKLQQVLMEQQRTAVYKETMRSEQVKQYITRMFGINEEVYYQKLEAFAVKYPSAEYMRKREEIVDMLVAFFAEKE